ncbi:MAG: chlorite dismutase family protein [Hyphomicrobiaceae bacterium]|nr:chlorite dismutase family protein [Hyphomicrobiaceae bacterium]
MPLPLTPSVHRYTFSGAVDSGAADAANGFQITSISPVIGEGIPAAVALVVAPSVPAQTLSQSTSAWQFDGLISNIRYAVKSEVSMLRERQEGLGRPAARKAALIPIRKSAAWWALAQDERRAIFEETSHHTAVGMDYLPAIARQLFHSRDIGQPFDFLTWFEFADRDANAFDELLGRLRETAEWTFVEREVDIRLERA